MVDVKVCAKATLDAIETVIANARKESGQEVSFIVALLFDDGGRAHNIQVRIDSKTDHHFCDKLTGIMETWWDCNHKSRSDADA
jgi:hypothetical protein